MGWYGVRHVIKWGASDHGNSYEERVTLWRAGSFDDAIRRAATEAAERVKMIGDGEVLDVFQAYLVTDEDGSSQAAAAETVIAAGEQAGLILEGERGLEVFSLIRDSDLSAKDYVDRVFDTGTEHQRTVP
jgi:pyruvoyl-dependent arginine decarboxylase (PvlArgDC)